MPAIVLRHICRCTPRLGVTLGVLEARCLIVEERGRSADHGADDRDRRENLEMSRFAAEGYRWRRGQNTDE